MKQYLLRFAADTAGVDLVEYALLAGLVTLAAAAGLSSVGSSISSLFGGLDTYLATLVR
jgi:pilus assembly protein Flp/PilA